MGRPHPPSSLVPRSMRRSRPWYARRARVVRPGGPTLLIRPASLPAGGIEEAFEMGFAAVDGTPAGSGR